MVNSVYIADHLYDIRASLIAQAARSLELNRRGKSAISTMCLIQNHFESLLCSSSYHHRECHNEKDRRSTF